MAARNFVKALEDSEEIQLSVSGRVSGRHSSRPVWFVLDGKTLYLLPVKGSDTEWYKNVVKNPTVTLAAKGAKCTGKATPVSDPAKVRDLVERFREKYGAGEVKKYYSKLDVAVRVSLR